MLGLFYLHAKTGMPYIVTKYNEDTGDATLVPTALFVANNDQFKRYHNHKPITLALRNSTSMQTLKSNFICQGLVSPAFVKKLNNAANYASLTR